MKDRFEWLSENRKDRSVRTKLRETRKGVKRNRYPLVLSWTFVRDVIVRNKDFDGVYCRRYTGLTTGLNRILKRVD